VEAPAADAPAMSLQITDSMRELDSRTNDGIHVQLLWCEIQDRVTVVVDDTKTGKAFMVEVGKDQPVLDVFNHPFAYAA
jgi:hypothetical protein